MTASSRFWQPRVVRYGHSGWNDPIVFAYDPSNRLALIDAAPAGRGQPTGKHGSHRMSRTLWPLSSMTAYCFRCSNPTTAVAPDRGTGSGGPAVTSPDPRLSGFIRVPSRSQPREPFKPKLQAISRTSDAV